MDYINDAQGPYAVIAQVDNYVKDQGTRRHLLGGGVGNFVQAATETRMAAGAGPAPLPLSCRESHFEDEQKKLAG